jgi:hypothetical protein
VKIEQAVTDANAIEMEFRPDPDSTSLVLKVGGVRFAFVMENEPEIMSQMRSTLAKGCAALDAEMLRRWPEGHTD